MVTVLVLGVLAAIAGCSRQDVIVMPCLLPLSLTVTPASATIFVGDSAAFRSAAKATCGQDVTLAAVSWSTTNAAVARIGGATDSTAQVIATGAGQVTVIVSLRSDPNVKAGSLVTTLRLPSPAAGRLP